MEEEIKKINERLNNYDEIIEKISQEMVMMEGALSNYKKLFDNLPFTNYDEMDNVIRHNYPRVEIKEED